MKFHQLPSITGKKKRRGRGIGSGGAKSGRGMKGQRSRAGSVIKAGFEGGQTPLYQRLPKGRGAKQVSTPQTKSAVAITVGRLSGVETGAIVGPGQLRRMGLLPERYTRVKLMAGGGDAPKDITVRVHGATEAAEATIKKAGGKVELIKQ